MIPMDVYTELALGTYGCAATAEMYRRLKVDRQLCGTRCTSCGRTSFPPRSHCPGCFHPETEWVPVGAGATLYAFTSQFRGTRFTAPEVIGIVDIPDVGLVVAPIGGSMETLSIGQPLQPEVIDLNEQQAFFRFEPLEG
jgi:uncharacterized OB-fold protein